MAATPTPTPYTKYTFSIKENVFGVGVYTPKTPFFLKKVKKVNKNEFQKKITETENGAGGVALLVRKDIKFSECNLFEYINIISV